MGAWGITAFESDAGLDVNSFIKKNLPQDRNLTLKTLLDTVKKSEYYTEGESKIGDSHPSPLTITEIIFKIKDNDFKEIDYEWDKPGEKYSTLGSFTADKESLIWLKDFLTDNLASARQNTEPKEGKIVHEYNGWFFKDNWIGWQKHMETLIERLAKLSDDIAENIELMPNEGQNQEQNVSM